MDREDVIVHLSRATRRMIDGWIYKLVRPDVAKKAVELLKEQRKKGHWIEKEDYNMDTYYDCSVCGESWTTIEGIPWENGMNYCPHCGADMR